MTTVRSSKVTGWSNNKFWYMFLKCGLTKCLNFCWDMLILKCNDWWHGSPIGQYGICFAGNNCWATEEKQKKLFTGIGHMQRYLKCYSKFALISEAKGSERNIEVISDKSNAKCPDFDEKWCTKTGYCIVSKITAWTLAQRWWMKHSKEVRPRVHRRNFLPR